MGKCLSCCPDTDRPLQNGHAVSSTAATKSAPMPGVIPASFNKYRAEPVPVQLPADYSSRRPSGGPTAGTHTAPPHSTTDKKMFSQYNKLPPIKKPSNIEQKRTSLTSRDFSENKIQVLFEHYKDADEDMILAEGIEKFCNDLDVRPDEFRVLVLAWKFDAETMCRFTRSEFVTGCKKLRVDSIKGIQSKFSEMLTEVQNKQTFKDLYRWTYKFGLDTDIGQRTLPVDMALSLWRLVFSQSEPPILQRWLDFLDKHPTVRGMPKDTWDMFLNFTEAVGNDLSTYDDTEAWPSLFDDFVEYENDRQNQNVTDRNGKDHRDSL